MGLARWMSWSAWETDKLRKSQQTTAEYTTGWTKGQVDLVAGLLHQRITLDQAEAALPGLRPKRSNEYVFVAVAPPQYAQGWYDGQADLVAALRDGRVTIRAAAVRLGMALEGELPPDVAGGR